MKMRWKKRSYLSIVTLIIMIVLDGCGREKVPDIPELLDPVAISESCRPVEYGDVGDIWTTYGTVVPEDHCYFRNIAVRIDSIAVKIGDYVEPGDILAYIDIGSTHEEINDYRQQIKYINQLFEKDNEIYELKHDELEFASTLAYENNEKETVEQIAKDISELEENHNYDGMLHEYQLSQIEEEIKERNKLVEEEMILADVSGYVTYAKDLSLTNMMDCYENIVVISNSDNRYIEANSIDLSQPSRSMAGVDQMKRFYTEIHQERYDLEVYDYTPQEKVMIDNKSKYPKMRFMLKNGENLPECSTSIPIFMTVNAVENVLRVANDSIFEDANGKFVYVKENDKKELRYIEIGKVGKDYTEVKSGLSEGEMVSYSVESQMPVDYQTYEIKKTDFLPTNSVMSYSKTGSVVSSYYSDQNGQLIEIVPEEKQKVSKGDTLLKITSDKGSAKLKELSDAITALNEDYELQKKQNADLKESIYKQRVAYANRLAVQMAEYENQIQSGLNGKGEKLTPEELSLVRSSLDMLKRQGGYQHSQFDLQEQQADVSLEKMTLIYENSKKQKSKEYAKAKKDNDGNGTIQICATEDGIFCCNKLTVNQMIYEGDLLFSIVNEKNDMVIYSGAANLKPDQKVVFASKDRSKQYEGIVIGIADPNKVYLTERDEHVYLSTVLLNQIAKKYYIKVSDPAFFEEEEAFEMLYAEYTLYDTCVVPARTIKLEIIEEVEYLYVWRVVNGMLVKQYVKKVPDSFIGRPEECIISGLKPGDVLALDRQAGGE